MLAHLVKIQERVFEPLAEGGHATKRCPLELLALVQTLAILEEADIVSSNGLNQVLRGRDLAQSDVEVVGIVKSV